MNARPLNLTRFDSLTDNVPKQHDARTFEQLVQRLSDSSELSDKHDGDLWSPASYPPGATRRNENVQEVACFVADLDGVPYEKWKLLAEPFEYVAHTTHSHTVEKESWRLVFPLPRPVPAAEWAAAWARGNLLLGGLLDTSCADAARFYYHAAHAPGAEHDAFHHTGRTLDLSQPADANLWSVSGIREYWRQHKTKGRHDAARTCVLNLERLRDKGANVDDALQAIRREFVSLILNRATPREADKEWNDLVTGARKRIEAGDVLENSVTSKPIPAVDLQADEPDNVGTKRKQSTADRLVSLGLTLYRFTLSDDGDPLAVPLHGSPLAKPVRGDGAFGDELAAAYYTDTGKTANSNALNEALRIFAGRARESEREPVYYRCAVLDNRIVYDLGETNGAVVEITANGFRILEQSPVVFRRAKTLSRLPRPTVANLDAFRDHVPADDPNYRMLVAWAAGVVLGVQVPILFPEADQGAGKTTLVRYLKRLLDPSPAEVNPPPRDEKHWRTVATNSHVVVLDNVSRIEAWLSDALCRAVTGDGAIERTLYSDNTPTVYAFRRPVVVTSIHLANLRGDLSERLLPVELRRISDDVRRPETELRHAFDRDTPEILAGLYQLAAAVLAVRERVKVERVPRMAEFAAHLAALDNVTGWRTFDTFAELSTNVVAQVADNDDVGRFVLSLADGLREPVVYSTSDLLAQLRASTQHASPDFPRNPSQLGKRLAYLVTPLEKLGVVVVQPRRTSVGKTWRIHPRRATSATCAASLLSLSVDETERGSGEEGRDA